VRSTQSSLSEGKYWSIVADLPSPALLKELIEIFFTDLNWYYSLLERHYFDNLLNSWLVTSNFYHGALRRAPLKSLTGDELHFPALLFQVIAIGLEFLPSDASTLKLLSLHNDSSRHHLSGHYSSRGMDLMDILGRFHATLTSVQQDLLRCLWLKLFGRGSESWHALGNAVRYFAQLYRLLTMWTLMEIPDKRKNLTCMSNRDSISQGVMWG
jgi:Fungal specific transcription factor domain